MFYFSLQFSSITYDATFKRKVILCPAAGRKYTVSESCICHWQSIKTNPEIDASVLEYIKKITK
jgi:hypothetical protein